MIRVFQHLIFEELIASSDDAARALGNALEALEAVEWRVRVSWNVMTLNDVVANLKHTVSDDTATDALKRGRRFEQREDGITKVSSGCFCAECNANFQVVIRVDDAILWTAGVPVSSKMRLRRGVDK